MFAERQADTRGHDRGPLRLLAQRTFFSGPFPAAPSGLYYRMEFGAAVRERGRVAVAPHAWLSTNTYFGRFPASYWQRWTEVTEVELDAVAVGSGELSIVASDSDGDTRTIATAVVNQPHGAPVRLTSKIDRFVDGGALWLDVRTGAEPLTVEQVRWSVPAPDRPRPAAVVICTFNRADDCITTLATLAADDEAARIAQRVYVVDQGSDPLESRERFGTVARSLGDKLRYLRQPNLGGAGGFTRGLYELAENVEPTHALLMDDDIMLEPDIVVRMTAFAHHTVEPTIVGGQMLYLLHPDQLHTGAEATDLVVLRAGLPVTDALVGADVTDEQQDRRVDAEYNAWWSCLVPAEVVAGIGYPLPLFFQWDDIEYGLRARAAGYPTVTLPGAGVWHADFHWKEWDDWPRYFSLRNGLIVSALYGGFDLRRNARFLADELAHYLVSMRYGLAATLIKAVEDFLAGPEMLADGGVEAVAAVRKLRAEYPETSRHPACRVPGMPAAGMVLAPAAAEPSRPGAVLAKRLLWQLLGRSRGAAAISARDSYWWHVSLFDTAVVTEPSQEGVRVRRRDRELLLSLGRRGLRVLARLAREGEATRRRYRAALPELTSRGNWERLFDAR